MGIIKIEKNSQFWFGLLILVLSVIYILTSLGKAEWTTYIAVIFGYFLVIFLIVEGQIINYFKTSGYKKLGFGDIVVGLAMITAGALAVNTTLLIPSIGQAAPEWLTKFGSGTGVTVSVVAGVLAIIFILTSAKRFR